MVAATTSIKDRLKAFYVRIKEIQGDPRHIAKGMAIGVVGTLIGVCGGIILCMLLSHYKFIELPGDVYYITTLPVVLKVADVAAIAVSALVICFLATLYPARQASRLDPVEAIRYG